MLVVWGHFANKNLKTDYGIILVVFMCMCVSAHFLLRKQRTRFLSGDVSFDWLSYLTDAIVSKSCRRK